MRPPFLTLSFPLALIACVGPGAIPPGQLSGQPQLFPEGCTDTADRVCFVSDPVRYVPGPTGVLWETVAYDETSRPLGTTDGASIPQAVWSIVGTPYSPEFIRPAILHDHYTWPENRIRPWRDTHLAFFYALRDENVEPMRAYLMYYAVYSFGGHWAELVVPEDCEERCEYEVDPTTLLGVVTYGQDPIGGERPDAVLDVASLDGGRIDEASAINSEAANRDVLEVWDILNRPGVVVPDQEQTLRNIEDLARLRHPDNPFLQHGDRLPLTRDILECLGLLPGSEHSPDIAIRL